MKKETFGLWSGLNFLSASQPSTTSATANRRQMSKQKHYLRVGRWGGEGGPRPGYDLAEKMPIDTAVLWELV